jgi:hypothetical protein
MQISNTIALVTGATGCPVTRRPRSAEARHADQVALGVGEVAHDQA